ncbi:hypothetical protein IHE44_0011390 [Lamprotornis superbus]|uniref:Uncharacterized protein n=1 Tax=Lamprotornis superbus TaxID=245042 RepID=A0A835NI44_9PASS|nr:hypothetical protein IHE44_0011390 [Lamprotornis superbus]
MVQCSQTCGGGVQKRDTLCKQRLADGSMVDLPETFCPMPRTVTQQACKNEDCPNEWLLSDWTQSFRLGVTPALSYDKENRKEEEEREQEKRGMERRREERYKDIILLYKSSFMEGCGNCLVEIVKEILITLQSCPTCTLLMGIYLGILLKLVEVVIKPSARRHVLAVKMSFSSQQTQTQRNKVQSLALDYSTVPLKQGTLSDRKEVVTGARKESKPYRTGNNKYFISLLCLHSLYLYGQMLLCFTLLHHFENSVCVCNVVMGVFSELWRRHTESICYLQKDAENRGLYYHQFLTLPPFAIPILDQALFTRPLCNLVEWVFLSVNKSSQWRSTADFTNGAGCEPVCWKGATSFWKNWLKILTKI